MSLKNTILNDIKEAMKTKDIKKRDALRLLSSAIKQIEVDERKELSDEDIIKIIQKQVKQRNDSITQYKQAGREDLAEKELEEISYYEVYLPKQLTEAELQEKISSIIAKTGASSMKDMGKVMGIASKELAGSADGKRISQVVKELLQK
ncbi:MAG: GatB/YqeY domain-containing protein [Epsilonproteobacteria bacterium]|nr:GatB/YqeY domain-containing protein [Campylobacterota bacterium]